jgi:hypothetical protein
MTPEHKALVAERKSIDPKGTPNLARKWMDRAVDAIESLSTQSAQPQAGEPVAERIADAVLSWMVKFDLLDAGNEYGPEDVLAVLNDLAPASPQPANPPQVTERTLSGETVNGIPVLAYMWEEELPGGDTARSVAYHWSTPPSYAKNVIKLVDVTALTIGAGGQAVKVKPLDLSNLLKHAFSAGYVSAAGDAGWTDYDPTECAAFSRILSVLSHPHPADERVVEAMHNAKVLLKALTGPDDAIAQATLAGIDAALEQEGR